MLVFFFVASIVTQCTVVIPIVIAALAIPIFELYVKHNKRLMVFCFLCFVFLGVFSATFYSATVKSSTSDEFSDLPDVLNILLKNDPGTNVYSPSSYNYFTNRVLKMAHLNLTTTDTSCNLYLIDKNYISNANLNNYQDNSNFTVIFNGNKFMILNRIGNS
jgi:hypothetical protein